MDKNFLLKITNELYQLTLLFPKKEPLRYKMRELADDILAKCLTPGVKQNPVGGELEVLDSFFEVAKSQNWVKAQDILNLQQEYSKLNTELPQSGSEGEDEGKPRRGQTSSPEVAAISGNAQDSRQEKILAFLRESGQAQVWQVKQILPEVTKRTLRRDFEHLLGQGVIERIGERNDTFYQLKGVRTQLGHTYI